MGKPQGKFSRVRPSAPPPRQRGAVPTVMLTLLMLAFGGSLALKAYEERQFADNSTLVQQAREAEALSGHVRAELVGLQARMEALLMTGSSLESIRRNAKLDAVSERTPPEGVWAQLIEDGGVRVYANLQDRWVQGTRASAALMPEALDERNFYLASSNSIPLDARFESTDFERSAVACAPVPQTEIAACVFRPAPLFGIGDLNRLIIYGLLLAAPLLAVSGLVTVIRRLSKEKEEAAAKVPTPAAVELRQWAGFEVTGVIGLWRWTPSTQLLTIGPEGSMLLGATRDGEMTLDEFTTVIAEEDRRRVRQILEGARPRQQVNVSFLGSGRMAGRHFEMIGGDCDGVFSGAILNVSDRIQAQTRSRRAEALARTALDAHPGPFAVWNNHKRLTHWNAAFARTFNLDKGIVQAGASYDLIMSEIAKFVRVERPLGEDANSREMMLLSDIWIRLVDRRTATDGLITVGLDITNMKRQEVGLQRSERRLRAMVEELERTRGQAQELADMYAEAKTRAERAAQAKGSFLSNMSHELRTPLTHINGFADMMAQEIYGPLGNDRYREYAEDIVGAGKHLEEMINDILDMSKVEAGKMRLSPAWIDPEDAVDAAIKLSRRRAADREVALVFDPDDDLPEINGDHRAIKQMTFNLITNAIKFTDPGGEIRVTVVVEGKWLVIRVKDSGIGIAPEDLPRLAQPFEQVTTPEAKQRNVRGTGLGLALTKSFAEMHGGYITIDSTVGVGTTVSIYLPTGKPAPAPNGRTDPILEDIDG